MSEGPAQRRPRGRPFQKGKSGNPGGQAREADAAGVPALLRAMRFVMTYGEGKDRTQYQRECREWLKSDRKGFLTKLADLEKAILVGQGKASGSQAVPEPEKPVAVVPDESEERLIELYESLRRGFKSGDALPGGSEAG